MKAQKFLAPLEHGGQQNTRFRRSNAAPHGAQYVLVWRVGTCL